MESITEYKKSAKYPDLEKVYSNCSGPGGLKLAEFIADKLDLKSGIRLLDIGMNRGYQTCFLAKEYGVFVVGIDPGDDPRYAGTSNVDGLMSNAESWGVSDRILGVKVGVPDTGFADNSFDAVYSTDAFDVVRGFQGEDKYRECLVETLRVLRPGGLFGYGDPMHKDVPIPEDLIPLVTEGKACWGDCFATLDETVDIFKSVGFEIVEAGLAPDAQAWWEEYAEHDPGCKAHPEEDPQAIHMDGGRWITFGYVIARKPRKK
ncbi:SAM-dependent methyltransferase [Candidatus Hydrogenedentota bacterium]